MSLRFRLISIAFVAFCFGLSGAKLVR